tara:strand:- start:313 stop:525 length:213 start_codon:yes stop_codon:yes gene_type:complete
VKIGNGMAISRRLAEISSANSNILEHLEIMVEESRRLASNAKKLADIVEQVMNDETWEMETLDGDGSRSK